MTEQYLIPIAVADVTEEDLAWLAKGCALQPQPVASEVVLAAAREDKLGLFRIASGGIMVIYINSTLERTRELFIWLLVGKSVLRNIVGFCAELDALAAKNNCHAIAGLVSRPGLARVYERVLGAKPIATVYHKEV